MVRWCGEGWGGRLGAERLLTGAQQAKIYEMYASDIESCLGDVTCAPDTLDDIVPSALFLLCLCVQYISDGYCKNNCGNSDLVFLIVVFVFPVVPRCAM